MLYFIWNIKITIYKIYHLYFTLYMKYNICAFYKVIIHIDSMFLYISENIVRFYRVEWLF